MPVSTVHKILRSRLHTGEFEWLGKVYQGNDLIVRALRDSFAIGKRDHDKAVSRLRLEIDRLQSRLEAVYIDKLDGNVTDEFYRCVAAQWQDELGRYQRDMTWHLEASAYMEEGVALLTLARKAHRLFEAASGIEKRRLLNFALSNCT